jgi:hypothetical protein
VFSPSLNLSRKTSQSQPTTTTNNENKQPILQDLGLDDFAKDLVDFGGQHHSPPLMQWIVPALMCALAYALYNIFIKKGSATIHPILGTYVLKM